MRVETEIIKTSRVYLSNQEQEKIEKVAQMFYDIGQQADSNELIAISSEINEKINEFLDDYVS